MSELITRLNQKLLYEMDSDFCVKNSVFAIDDECARASYLSSRWVAPMLPIPYLKRIIDTRKNYAEKLKDDLESVGVQFSRKDGFNVSVGHGHINIFVDGVIAGGVNGLTGSAIMIYLHASKLQYKAYKNDGFSSFLVNQVNLLMSVGGINNAIVFIGCPEHGGLAYEIIPINYKIAKSVYNTLNAGVESADMPPRLGVGEPVKKCETCPFNANCYAPTPPPATCRTCKHFIIGPDGFGGCSAQGGIQLSHEQQMNLHKCTYHLYKESFLSGFTLNKGIDIEGNRSLYVNLVNNMEFINGKGEGEYTSYEISAIKGMELLGDKQIDKLKKMFSAIIED